MTVNIRIDRQNVCLMDLIVSNVRSTVQAARHLLWYVGYQIGTRGPRND